ncbi:unnamed protein product [Durusdinium trenchii]|uniref:Uncharacterized protein n=1 Tax=Durusdinium trenchii TaxID=1381693 RepID=A0ABP0JZU5_9DINO
MDHNQSVSLHDDLGRISRSNYQGNATFLGASRDFWIVLASSVGGMVLCFLMTFLTVEINTRRRRMRDSDIDEELPTDPIAKPFVNSGCTRRMVFKELRYGQSFAFHADLALRGALVATFCASAYVFDFLSWWQNQGWSMSYVVVILAFTLYLDLGSTVLSAWTGFYGTVIAVLNCWLMFGLYPEGVKKEDMSSYIFGWIDFFVVVLLMFALGFSTNAKMYALSWQAYFSMCFLNPFDATVFSRGISDVMLQAAETGALMGTIIGCIFAVFLAILPKNISALSKAQDMLLDLTWSHGRLTQQLLERGCLSMGPQAAVVFSVEVQGLQNQLTEIKSLLDTSWWECFDLGASGRARLMMIEICRSLDLINDWLESMVMAVQHSKLAKDSVHALDAVQKELMLLQFSTKDAFRRSVTAAVHGDLDADTEERLEYCLAELEEHQIKLNEGFKSKMMQRDSWKQFFTPSHLPQFALAASTSAYSQKVSDMVLSLSEFEPQGAIGPCRGLLQGIWALPGKDLTALDANINVLKLLLTYTLCFVVGRFGIGAGYNTQRAFVPPYNATPAGTVAYLIFQGGNQAAAIKKNMDRFMGVSFGTMLGALTIGTAANMLPHVGWGCAATLYLILFLSFEFLAFYTYFSSPSFFYVGLMFSCFYAGSACQGFQGLESLGRSGYQNIMSQLLAILIATLMDVISDKSLSIRATANLEKWIEVVHEALASYPLNTRAESSELRKEGLAFLSEAKLNGASAAREPRCFGMPWREELWNRIMTICSESWSCLTIVGTTENPRTEQEKSLRHSVDVLMKSRNFQQALRGLEHRAQKAFELAVGFMCQTYYDERNPQLIEMQEKMLSHSPPADAVPKIMAEIQPSLTLQDKARILLDNQICAVAMFLMMFEALCERQEDLEKALLEQPEMWQLLGEEDMETLLEVESSDD